MKKLAAMLLAVLLATGLFTGCGRKQPEEASTAPEPSVSSSQSVSEEPSSEEEPREPDTVFEPRAPQNDWAVAEAADWVKEQLVAINNRELIEPDQFTGLFAEANQSYKDSDFEAAKTAYETILAECPTHSGALNNIALACLQLEENESALRYCMLNGVLHPDFHIGRVNLYVAGHALGFSPKDLDERLENFDIGFPTLWEFYDHIADDVEAPDGSYVKSGIYLAWLFNDAYATMEYEIPLEYAEEEDQMKLAAGEITEEELQQKIFEKFFENLEWSLQEYELENPDDEDLPQLREYMNTLRELREKQR